MTDYITVRNYFRHNNSAAFTELKTFVNSEITTVTKKIITTGVGNIFAVKC